MDTYSLLVYVDNAVTPVRMDIATSDATDLVMQVQRSIGLPVLNVSYWDESAREYVALQNLTPLQGGMTKVWVATSGMKALPITEEKDPLEFTTIREQIEQLTPPADGCVFEVWEILRVQNHAQEQNFKKHRSQLFDPAARTALKFYADAQAPDRVLNEGFRMPSQPGPYGFGVIFGSDVTVPYPSQSAQFVLCEVAIGRYTTLHNEEDRAVTYEVLQHMGYDSVVARTSNHPMLSKLEENIIYHPHQAIPRYLITCGLKQERGLTRSKHADTCRHHTGEALKLWCLTCDQLVCAFCMFSTHASHTAKDITEVAGRERDLLMRCEVVLQRTIEQRQRDLGDLEKMKAHYNNVARDCVRNLQVSVEDLKGHLDAQMQNLLREIDDKEMATAAKLNGVVTPLQGELATLIAKQSQLREALQVSRVSRPSSQAEFVKRTVDLHTSLNTAPRFDEAPDATGAAPGIDLRINTQRVLEAVKQLAIDDRSGLGKKQAHPLGTVALHPEGLLARDDSLDTVEARLQVLETGHIWIIPNVREHFGTDQTRDIFSDPFLMDGQYWEIKLSFLQAERALAVYLHAVRHHYRTNFRVAVLKTGRWHVKSTRNWADEFRGRGWGIKPFIGLDELMNYVENDTLKWVIAFTGDGLY
ncbi:hypothetical protein DIPPA_25201 [Diplonema papillatum]|nr:hypothetical protein DIPPA_25201 [Diplonema papillatum]